MKLYFWGALIVFAAPHLFAAPTTTEIRHKTRDLEKVKAELNRKRQETEQLKREADEISSDMKKSESKIQSVEHTLGFTRSKTRDVQQKIASAKNEHDHLIQDVAQCKSNYEKSAVQYYLASSVLSPSDVTTIYSRRIMQGQAGVFFDSEQKRERAKDNLDNLAVTGQTLREEMERQESILGNIRAGYASKEKLLEKKKTRTQIIQGELKELERTSEELSGLIDVLRTKVKKEQDQEKQERIAKQKSGLSPIRTNSLPWPLRGAVIEKFGRQKQAEIGTPYISNGIVVRTASLQPVKSVANGTVLYVGQFMRYGQMILLEHPGDWYSVYGRLDRWFVEKGDTVTVGQEIGQTGVTAEGKAETYFELRFYGKPVDPLPWLTP